MKWKFTSWPWLTTYGVILYLLFLVINLPANVVWSLAPQQLKRDISVSSLQGSAWSARADSVIINGLELGKTNWTLNPLLLFVGKLGGHITVRNAMGQAQSGFTTQSAQLIELSNLTGEFNAAILDPAIRPFTSAGTIKGELNTLQLQRKTFLSANGTLQWNNASITGVQEVALGNIRLNATPESKGTRLQVSNEGGLIAITGDIRVAGNGRYTLNLLLSNRDKSRKDIEGMLAVLGRADAQGRVRLNQQGMLQGW
jgi:general secretion pathway protein N